MGYDVHVVRGAESSSDSVPIESAEWRLLVESLPDFRLVGEVDVTSPAGETLRFSAPDLAVWTAHPSGVDVPFDFRAGRVVVTNPDGPILERLRSLARALGARVQGDDDEFYDVSPAPESDPRPPTRRRFWRR